LIVSVRPGGAAMRLAASIGPGRTAAAEGPRHRPPPRFRAAISPSKPPLRCF